MSVSVPGDDREPPPADEEDGAAASPVRPADGAPPEPPASRFRHDPESLALRAAPTGIVRLRKGLLIGAAAAALVLLAGASWLALDPPGLQLAASGQDLSPASADSLPDGLAGLPQGYAADAPPPLGPPLPGDLGRAILAHERASTGDEVPGEGAVSTADEGARAAAAERQRLIEETRQARHAPILMEVSRGLAAGSPGPGAGADASTGSALPGRAPVRQDDRGGVGVPASGWLVSAGSTISASLLTGLNSDLPGMVVAQVTRPVFDSPTGQTLLIPQGARILGRYDSQVAFGQRRAMLVWERLVMPDGSSVLLDNAPATDSAGYAGVADRVDFHTWQLLKGIGLSTLLGIGTELTFGDGEADLVRALRESIQRNADRAGQKIVERNLDVAPTVTVRPGHPVRVLVHKDLVLPPWRG